jgi:hypothetical protein
MIDKRRAQLLLGETIREGGILVVVFGPLDALFQKEGPGELIVALMVSIGLLLLTLGIIIESIDQTSSRTP